MAAFPASKRPPVGPICLLSDAFCPNRPVIVIETESLVMPLGDGLLGQRPELPLQARTQPRPSYTRTPPCRWIEGPSRATLLQMEGLAVSSFAPPAGLWAGWTGWAAPLCTQYSAGLRASRRSRRSPTACSCSRPASLKEKMSCTSYLAANELQSASGDELRWALTGL